MKAKFKDIKLGDKKLAVIAQANEIIVSYQKQGYRMTLRQLYYQFVSRALIENTVRSYKNLGETLSDGRLAGLIDWEAIEDRVRQPRTPLQFNDVADLVNTATNYWYRLPRWEGQENYVELWVEKEALSGVLQPLAKKHHITLMVNKGYSSQSAMYEAAHRFLAEGAGKTCHLLYLGDHDPSGEDMVRDVQDRLAMFGADVEVEKLALTMAQVKQYDPPPNPAKLTDSRGAKYVEEHGEYSWEVDALPPNVLNQLIDGRVAELVDQELVDGVLAREEKDKAALRVAAQKIVSAE